MLNGPHGSVKQNADGTVVTGLDYAPGLRCEDDSDQHGRTLLQLAAKMVPAFEGLKLRQVTRAEVAIPKGELPIVGFCDPWERCYVASMMSGITMAPLMGRLIAHEMLYRTPNDLLRPYRPQRLDAHRARS